MASCPHLSTVSLSPPTLSSRVHKDECTSCFIIRMGIQLTLDKKDSENGVDVCLTCYIRCCRNDERSHSKMHYSKHRILLEMTSSEDYKIGDSRENDEEKYDVSTSVRCLACDVEIGEENLKSVVEGVKSMEEEITSCRHVEELQQGEAKKLESNHTSHCADCELAENLWLCLTCGNLGVGGNGHGLGHFDKTGHNVSVKLGTITPEGTGDVFCYLCGEERLDPKLATHLANFGINVMSQEKTEKSIAELQLEQNLKFDFSMTTEDGKDLTPLFGPGYTGLKNLGNTCYMASVLQTTFAIPSFMEKYSVAGQEHIRTCRSDASQCFHCQMAKMFEGLHSGRYSMPVVNEDGEIRGQDGIAPAMFKSLIGKGHAEFSSMRQQDAQEFFQHLIKIVEQKERAVGTDPTDVFKFSTEQRLQCTSCFKCAVQEGYRVTLIQLPVPAKKDSSVDADENAYLPVTYEECLETFAAVETRNFTCPTCKKGTELTCSTKFVTFPKVLVTPMSRFVVGSNYVMQKLNVDIKVPLTLDLSGFKSTGLQSGETPFPEDSEVAKAPSVDVEALSQLMGMGFPENRCTKALLKTGNNGADVAMNWLFEHMEDPDIDDPIDVGGGSGGSGPSEAELSQLMDMGFTLVQAKKAMKETSNNVERAVDWLFNHGHEVMDEDMAEPAPATETVDNAPPKYELMGFISHRGPSAHCGHYVAHVKVGSGWVLFNDNKVVEVENVEKAAKEAYMFFYKKV
ncbi:hypothetical protein BC829DRAFT_402114 [Chytridium lagenaria]|nr:hypothetical protein BC829DRAFT_402114 [Chytridium lagenaria]